MTTASVPFTLARIRCHWRPLIMVGAGLVLFGLFWFASRYPQLFSKAAHVGHRRPDGLGGRRRVGEVDLTPQGQDQGVPFDADRQQLHLVPPSRPTPIMADNPDGVTRQNVC